MAQLKHNHYTVFDRQAPILSEYGNLIDPLLHRLIQLITKHFILTWYQSISTSKDYQKQQFINHVQSTIINLTIKLEGAFKSIDYLQLFLIDLPELINLHVQFISITIKRLHQLDSCVEDITRITQSSTFDQLFVQLHPHPALQLTTNALSSSSLHLIQSRSTPIRDSIVTPIPRFPHLTTLVSPTYLRLLIESVLQVLLPKEEWESENERLILREIILNAVLVPILYEFTQPRFIYTQLLIYLIQSNHSNQSSSSNHHHPSIKNNANLNLRSIWDQLSNIFNHLVHFLLLLPAILGSFIQLITAPTPIPIPDKINPRQFEPILLLLSNLLGNSFHLNQFFWLLNLATRISNRLLTKIVTHLIFNHLLSPIAISNLLIKINDILTDLDHNNDTHHETHQQKEHQDRNFKEHENQKINLEELDLKEIKTQVENLLCSKISNNFFKFLKPIKSNTSSSKDYSNQQNNQKHDIKNTQCVDAKVENNDDITLEREKIEFIRKNLTCIIDFHSSNVAFIIDFLDLVVIKLFPDLISNKTKV